MPGNAKALFDAAPDDGAAQPQSAKALFDAAPGDTRAEPGPSLGNRVMGAIGKATGAVKDGINQGIMDIGQSYGLPQLLQKLIPPVPPEELESQRKAQQVPGILKKDSPDWLAALAAFVDAIPGSDQGQVMSPEHQERAARFAEENPWSKLGIGLAGGLAQPMPAGPAKVPGVPEAPGVLSRLGDAMEKVGIKSGRRALSGGGSISLERELSDPAVAEAIKSNAIRPFGTARGNAMRLKTLRSELGAAKGDLIDDLEGAGFTGQDAAALARRVGAAKPAAGRETMNPSVLGVYDNAKDMLLSAVKPPTEQIIPGIPPAPSQGAIPLGERTVFHLPPAELPPAASGALPRGAKDVFRALPDEITPGEFQLLSKDTFALPPPQEAPPIAGATVTGPREVFKLPPPGAAGIPPHTEWIPTDNRLSLSEMEKLKDSAQRMASRAFRTEGRASEVGDAQKHVASILRQATEDAIGSQADKAPDLASAFGPLKERLGNVIEASNVANKAAIRAGRNAGASLTDTTMAAGGLAAGGAPGAIAGGVANKLWRTRGPSTLSWGAYKAGGLVQKLGQMSLTEPGRLGRFAVPLANAMRRGPDALAVAHFSLSQDPDYQRMTRELEAGNDGAAQ